MAASATGQCRDHWLKKKNARPAWSARLHGTHPVVTSGLHAGGVDLRSADAPARLVECVKALAEGLPIGPSIVTDPDDSHVVVGDADEGSWLAREGYAVLHGTVADQRLRESLARVMQRCVEAGLPAVFVYLLDDVWRIGDALRSRVSAMLGRAYLLEQDGWAWWNPPGQRGWIWPAHRDWSKPCSREAPERLNVWVALSDVPADRSCIYAVPLHADPHYPSRLDQTSTRLEVVRALPVEAGTALVWNENMLHWAGECSQRSGAPRVVISYSARRTDAEPRFCKRPLGLDTLDPLARVDLVAGLIAFYSDRAAPDVSPDVLRWAEATVALNEYAEQRTAR
jgi:hypothetical protein